MKSILTYHSIDVSGSVVSVHPDRFLRHVEILSEGSIPVVCMAELLDQSCTEGVAITFDDGFQNLASVAWPALRDARLPATVFVATDWMGKTNSWDPDDRAVPTLPLMDWDTLRGLHAEGLEVAAHTATHPRLTTVNDDDLLHELSHARSVIEEKVGFRPAGIAYPYGDCNERVVHATVNAGYSWAVTTDLAFLSESPDPFRLPRLDAYYLAKAGVMERWGTEGLARYLGFRRAGRHIRSTLHRVGIGQ